MKTTKYLATILLLLASFTALAPVRTLTDVKHEEKWSVVANDVTATVYHAVPAQCNADCLHTASMMKVIPDKIQTQRILAMERTMMAQYGISYGDIVRIEGTGMYDGAWQVQDTMNKRFAGQHKVDLMIPVGASIGKWTNITVYVAADEATANKYARQMKIS